MRRLLYVCLFVSIVIVITAVTLHYCGQMILRNRALYSTLCLPNNECIDNDHIPKVIYRTYKTRKLSDAHQQAWDFTAKHNPTYTQVLLDDDDLDAYMKTAMGGEVYDVFRALVPGAAKADFARYVLMYEKGGVYMDIKSGARDLCALIQKHDRFILSTWSHRSMPMMALWVLFSTTLYQPSPTIDFVEFQQWWLICAPGHPIMRKVIDRICADIRERLAKRQLMKKPYVVPNTQISLPIYEVDTIKLTGPWVYTQVITEELPYSDMPVRVVCEDGNGTFVYDVSGTHAPGKSYSGSGPMLRTSHLNASHAT